MATAAPEQISRTSIPADRSDRPFRIVILTHGGCELFIEEIARRREIEVGAVVVETVNEPKRPLTEKIRRSVKYDGWLATVKKFPIFRSRRTESEGLSGSTDGLLSVLDRKSIPFFAVENFHLPKSIELIRSINADLGIIWGTNIVKRSVFGLPRLGSINLHQGHAPYYRGGPTVFWELMNDEDRVGITVHFVEENVDTGDIVAQDFVPLDYDQKRYRADVERFLSDFRESLVMPSVELMAKATVSIANGTATRVRQDTSLGKRYRLPTFKEKENLRAELKRRFRML